MFAKFPRGNVFALDSHPRGHGLPPHTCQCPVEDSPCSTRTRKRGSGEEKRRHFPTLLATYNSRVLTSTCEAALQPTVAPSYSKGRTRQIPPTATRINYPGFVRGPLHPPAREWKIAESISARHRLLCARGVTQIPWPLSQDHAPPA